MMTFIDYLIFICFVYLGIVLLAFKFSNHKRETKTPPDEILALNLTNQEFIKTLNFLLMYGIIDLEEYNKLQVKSLPHLRG